jgi:hypothetical protein
VHPRQVRQRHTLVERYRALTRNRQAAIGELYRARNVTATSLNTGHVRECRRPLHEIVGLLGEGECVRQHFSRFIEPVRPKKTQTVEDHPLLSDTSDTQLARRPGVVEGLPARAKTLTHEACAGHTQEELSLLYRRSPALDDWPEGLEQREQGSSSPREVESQGLLQLELDPLDPPVGRLLPATLELRLGFLDGDECIGHAALLDA